MSVLVLTEAELRQCVGLDEASLQQVENAFTWLAEGKVNMPPIMHIEVDERSDMDIKGAYVRGLDAFALKMASGFYGNPEQGLPSSSGMVVVISALTGFCEAVMLDNGYLTDVRTGLAGAVAARHLSPAVVETVGVVGAGAQARYQIESLRLVRDFKRLLVVGRSHERVMGYVADMRERLGIEVAVADSMQALVRQSQVVVTTTPSRVPIIHGDWLHRGLHITAMGSDLPGKQELQPEVLAGADMVVCDSKSQCFKLGELVHGVSAGVLSEDGPVLELGEITSGRAGGRQTDNQITVCDLTGTGVQDTAIALVARQNAIAQGMGVSFD